MSDREVDQQRLADSNNLAWFVAGAVVGMTVAILITPAAGKDARRFISEKTREGKDAVTGTGRDVYDRSRDMIEKGRQLVEDAAELFERGRKLVRGD